MSRGGLAIIFRVGASLASSRRVPREVDPVFFLIRCIFWLSIVYSSMSWAVDAARPHALRDAVVQEGLAVVAGAKDTVVEGAKAWCVKSPERCLADASQLTRLVIANQSEDLSKPAAEPIEVAYPLPPMRLRRPATPRS